MLKKEQAGKQINDSEFDATAKEWEQFVDMAITDLKVKAVDLVGRIKAIEYEKNLFKRIAEHLDKAGNDE